MGGLCGAAFNHGAAWACRNGESHPNPYFSPPEKSRSTYICTLSLHFFYSPGPCNDTKANWYFESSSGKCTAFTFGGCEGNANRFETQEQCDRQCGLFRDQDVCGVAKDIGPCLGRFKKWHFDQVTH